MEFNASDKPTKLAIVCDDRQLNWAELDAEVDQAAAFLYEKLGPADTQQVIGLLFPNGWQFVVVYLAILKLGHIALPLDPTYKKLELGAVIEQIKPLVIVTSDSYKDSVSGHDSDVYIFDQSKNATSSTSFKRLRLPADRQIASLVFTSGTTGKPKAATYSHANHIWNIVVCSKVWQWDEKDSLLISLPLSHWYGLVMGLAGILYHGNTLYVQEWFDEEKTL
ncbi:MAG: class I adenylate-forming enzyme family protein, partial [Candidatus Saccharimonadales bacterium]